MATGDRKDPYRSFNFRIEIDGIAVGSFSEVSGLSSDGDVVEYRNGDDVPLHVRKLTGLRKTSNITLKRGYTQNRELWTCAKTSSTRRRPARWFRRADGRGTQDVLRWNFTAAGFIKLTGQFQRKATRSASNPARSSSKSESGGSIAAMPAYFTPGVYFERADAIVRRLRRCAPTSRIRWHRRGGRCMRGAGAIVAGNSRPPLALHRRRLSRLRCERFFENGGRKCYVVRVADRDTATGRAWNSKASRRRRLAHRSFQSGVWGNQLAVRLRTTHRAQTRTVVEPGATDAEVPRCERDTFRARRAGAPLATGRDPANPLRVVARVNGERERLEWDAPLTPDFSSPRRFGSESVEYTLTVFLAGAWQRFTKTFRS